MLLRIASGRGVSVAGPTCGKSIDQAAWLAELAAAINDAQRLTWAMGAAGENRMAMELYARLELVRVEIDQLRRSRRFARPEFNPIWSELRDAAD